MNGGVYLLDKPQGATSRNASAAVARSWGCAKYGHCGTLDPAASGVLPVMLGRATRLSPYLTGGSKVYSFTVVLGVTTDTDDMEGTTVQTRDASGITAGMVRGVLPEVTGSFRQKVPLYSAVRVGGVRAFKSARSGFRPDMPFREVSAVNWEVLGMQGHSVRLRVEVSSGTYIRALARDLGTLLGVGGAATGIVRERSGPFHIGECSGEPRDPGALLTMAQAVRDHPVRVLAPAEENPVLHGNPVSGKEEGMVALVSRDGRLLAMGRGSGGCVRPVCVLEQQ